MLDMDMSDVISLELLRDEGTDGPLGSGKSNMNFLE